jgi:polyhydroxybutyrate depolymerase
MSNGAAFSVRLACDMPERIAAAAAVTAMVYPLDCASEQATPIIGFHGTEDACVPFEGGQTQCGRRLPVRPIVDNAASWGEHNGCRPAPIEERVSEHVRRLAWDGCPAPVVLYMVEGGGHTWPGSFSPARLGASTQEIDATELIWAFFESAGGEG